MNKSGFPRPEKGMEDFEKADWLAPDDPRDAEQPSGTVRARRRGEFGLPEESQRDVEVGGRFAELARGEAQVSFARWRMTGFDAIIKLCLLGLYMLTFTLIIPPLVPLVFDAVTNGVLLFIFPFAMCAAAAVVLVLAAFDSYGKGLSYNTTDDLGNAAIVSYRDRTYNILMAGFLVLAHSIFGLIWVSWYAQNSHLNTDSDFKTFSRPVAQYYVLCGVNVSIYLMMAFFAALSVYSNSRYQLAVHLVDAFSQRVVKKTLEEVL